MDAAIRARLDRHIVAAQAIFYQSISGGLFEIMPDWGRGFSGASLPTFNIFWPLKPAGLTDETLADTDAFFSSRGTMYVVELVHDGVPQGPAFLNERRYQVLPPQPAMFLAGIPEDIQISSVNIVRVNTVPTLTAFWSLLQAEFDFALPDIMKLFPVAHLKKENLNSIRHYLAFLNEKPVGGGDGDMCGGGQ